MMNAKKEFLQALKQHRLLFGCDRVLLAVSGGADSMALLHLFRNLPRNVKPELLIGHFDHRLRGKASEEDAQFVQAQAQSYGIPCHVGHAPNPPKKNAAGVEEWARIARYDWLEHIAAAEKCQAIVTAHHADDQAETVLMNIVRGAGLRGISGMPWQRPISCLHTEIRLIRPLLGIRRADLLDYLDAESIPFRQDATNEDTSRKRNRVRHIVLPTIEKEMNPSAVYSLCELAQRCQADQEFLEQLTQNVLALLVVHIDTGAEVSLPVLRSLHKALRVRVLQSLLSDLSIPSGNSLGRVLSDIELGIFADTPQEDFSLPDGWIARKRYDKLIIEPMPATFEDYSLCMTPGISQKVPSGECFTCSVISKAKWTRLAKEKSMPDSHPLVEGFDLEAVRLPVTIRNRRRGDRMTLDDGVHKKVKDILIEAKVPRESRQQIPLLVDSDGTILWVTGVRRAGIGWVKDETKQVLMVRVR